MAEIWKPQSIAVYKGWIQDVLDEASDDLSTWEANFVADMQNKLLNNYNLTENQANKLEQIYAKYTK